MTFRHGFARTLTNLDCFFFFSPTSFVFHGLGSYSVLDLGQCTLPFFYNITYAFEHLVGDFLLNFCPLECPFVHTRQIYTLLLDFRARYAVNRFRHLALTFR